MTFNVLVKLFVVKVSVVFQTLGFRSSVEVFEFNLVCCFFFEVKKFGKVLLDLLLLLFVQWLLLFVQVVDDEEIFGIRLVEVYSIDFIVVWLTRTDNITEMVTVIKNIVRWVHKYFHLISNFKLDSNQVDVLLLEKNHNNIGELTSSIDALLQNNSIKLILSTSLIVMDPKLLFCQNLFHIWASLLESQILYVGIENIR